MSADPFDKYGPSPYVIGDQGEEESLRHVDARIRAITDKKPRRVIWQWLAVAAAALLFLFVNQFILNRKPDYAQLAAQFFQPFPNYQRTASRGSGDAARLQEAYGYYDRAEYAKSVSAFNNIYDRSVTDSLYYAIALQGIDRWDESSEILNSIKSRLPAEYRDSGVWYYALSLVALGDIKEAIPLIEEQSTGSAYFARKANDLLRAIR